MGITLPPRPIRVTEIKVGAITSTRLADNTVEEYYPRDTDDPMYEPERAICPPEPSYKVKQRIKFVDILFILSILGTIGYLITRD